MVNFVQTITCTARKFGRDQRGGATVLVALSLTVVLGAAALAVDYTRAVAAQQFLSSAADVAALAAASRMPDVAAARKAALEYVEKNLPKAQHGQVLAPDDIEFGAWDPETQTFDSDDDGGTVDSAKSIGSMTGRMSIEVGGGGDTGSGGGVPAVRITTRMAASNGNGIGTMFAWVFGRASMDVSSSAVAARAGPPCVLALNPTKPAAMSLNWRAKVTTVGCAVQVNSTAWPAFEVKDSASLNAADICVGGTSQLDKSTGAVPEPRDQCPGMKDPMAGLEPPDHSGCDYVDSVYEEGDITLEPGVYCGGLKIGKFFKRSNVTLSPGLYIMRDGPLSLNGITSVTGTDVSVFFTGDAAVLAAMPGVKLNLTAPTKGALKGLLFYQDPDFGGTHNLGGFSTANLRGVIYLPAGKLKSNSDSSITPEGSCLVLVADTLEFSGFSDLAIDITKADCRAALPGAYGRGIMLLD